MVNRILFYVILIVVLMISFSCQENPLPGNSVPETPDSGSNDHSGVPLIVEPGDIGVTVFSDSLARLVWTDLCESEIGYEIQWSSDIAFPEDNRQSTVTAADSVSFDMNDLVQETTYYVRIRTTGESSNSEWNTRTFTTLTKVQGQITINADVVVVNQRDVSINIGYAGVSEIRLFMEGQTPPNWIPFVSSVLFTLPEGEGTKNIIINLRNSAGTEYQVTKSIELDQTPPLVDELAVNGGSVSVTKSSRLTFSMSVPDAVRYQLSCNGGEWIDFLSVEENSQWELTDTSQGLKTLIFRFYDEAGNFTEASRQIEYDTVAPDLTAGPSDGDYIKNTLSRELRLISSELYEYRVRLNEDRWSDIWTKGDGAAEVLYSVSLPDRDGDHPFYVQIRDVVGNIREISGTFILDRTPPKEVTAVMEDTVVSNNTGNTIVLLSGAEADQITHYLVSATSTGFTADMVPRNLFQPGKILLSVLDVGAVEDQDCVFYIRLLDQAGNPVATSRIVNGQEVFKARTYQLSIHMDRLITYLFDPTGIEIDDPWKDSIELYIWAYIYDITSNTNFEDCDVLDSNYALFQKSSPLVFSDSAHRVIEIPRWGEADRVRLRFYLDEGNNNSKGESVIIDRTTAGVGVRKSYSVLTPWPGGANDQDGLRLNFDMIRQEE